MVREGWRRGERLNCQAGGEEKDVGKGELL